jgi:hypothetical protein
MVSFAIPSSDVLFCCIFDLVGGAFSIDWFPAVVGVVLFHGRGRFRRLRTKIFLIHNAGLVHDESHDAGIAVFSRVGHKCEAANELAVNHVIATRATFRRGSLFGENAIVKPIESLKGVSSATLGSTGHQRPCLD